MRAGARRWPPKYQCLEKSKTEKKINPKSGRLAQFHQCNVCKGEFLKAEVEVDHISPVVDPLEGFVSWDLFINRLFCDSYNLQTICKTCHKEKSKNERKSRSRTS